MSYYFDWSNLAKHSDQDLAEVEKTKPCRACRGMGVVAIQSGGFEVESDCIECEGWGEIPTD
jgi:DnaJ-class molecular chaperone